MGATTDPKAPSDTEGNKNDKTDDNEPQAVFDIYTYDNVSKTAKMEKFVQGGTVEGVTGLKLSQIRQLLISKNALTFRQKGSSFCNRLGAVANEDLAFTEYVESLDRGQEEPSSDEKSTEKNDEKSAVKDDKKGDKVQAADGSKNKKVHTIYLKSRNLTNEASEKTTEFLKDKLNLDQEKAALAAGKDPEKLTSSFDRSQFVAKAASGKVVHPADMTQRDWNIVIQTNSLLNGSYVRQPKAGITKKVERAMYPAFKLKPRLFYDYEVTFETSDIPPPQQSLRIPRFRVEDDSYVEVSENKSSVATAMAQSSLSEIAAEVAVGGGAFGYSAGLKGGYKNEESASKTENTTAEKNSMTITYNFPRVVLQLDEDSLELSDECKEDLSKVNSKETAEIFKDKYGCFFASRVELGGRLHATEDSAAMGNTSVSEKAKTLKAAASMSFSSPYVQASASLSYGSSKAEKNESSSSTFNNTMTWEAKGGDTLLCNNPPAWCGTVASFYNWRIVKQENLLAIEDILSRASGQPTVKRLFESFQDNTPAPKVTEDVVKLCLIDKKTGRYVSVSWMTEPAIVSAIDRTVLERYGNTPFAEAAWNFDARRSILLEETKESRSLSIDLVGETYRTALEAGGMIEVRNGKKRLQNGAKYSIRSEHAKGFIRGTSPIQGLYEKSLLFGKADNARQYFKMRPARSLKDADILDQDAEVYLDLYDAAGGSLGPIKEVQDGLLGADGPFNGKVFTLRYC